jgi:hypothetical protein
VELTVTAEKLRSEFEEANIWTQTLRQEVGKQARELQECYDMIHILQTAATGSEGGEIMAQHLASTQKMLHEVSKQQAETDAQNQLLRESNAELEAWCRSLQGRGREAGSKSPRRIEVRVNTSTADGAADSKTTQDKLHANPTAQGEAEQLDYHFRALVKDQDDFIQLQKR